MSNYEPRSTAQVSHTHSKHVTFTHDDRTGQGTAKYASDNKRIATSYTTH